MQSLLLSSQVRLKGSPPGDATPPSHHFLHLQPSSSTKGDRFINSVSPLCFLPRDQPSDGHQESILQYFADGFSAVRAPTTASKPCTICGKVFNGGMDLLRHTRTHTGEKPFCCPACPYRAAIKNHMRRHMLCRHQLNIADFPIDKLPG